MPKIYGMTAQTANQVQRKIGEHTGNKGGPTSGAASQQVAMIKCGTLFGVFDGCYTYSSIVKMCYANAATFKWEELTECYLCNPNEGEELEEDHIYLAVRYGTLSDKPLFAGECCPFGFGISPDTGNELCVLTAAPDSIDCTEAGFMVANKCFTGHVVINGIDFPVTFTASEG